MPVKSLSDLDEVVPLSAEQRFLANVRRSLCFRDTGYLRHCATRHVLRVTPRYKTA